MSDKETIILGGQAHEIEVRPITLICKAPNIPFDIQTPERVMIDSFMTVAHTKNVITLHPRTEKLFKMVFPDYGREVTPDNIRSEGTGMQHVLGLVDLSLLHLDAGTKFGWRYPEAYLHPAAQAPLADVLIALVGTERLLDIIL
jgi:hypothetical protein